MAASVMTLYGRICAATLARAHARSGDPIASYLGNSDVGPVGERLIFTRLPDP
jgi:hypothetical protein